MMKPVCKVEMNNEIAESDEFIAFIIKPDGDIGMFYQTDALSMGMAMQLCQRTFAEMLATLSEIDVEEIHNILGGPSKLEGVEVSIEIEDDCMEDSDYEEH